MRFQHGTNTYRDSCGETYIEFTGVSIKQEGDPAANTFLTESDAWRAYWAAFNKYVADNSAEVIEWRAAPYIRKSDTGGYAVYSRLSIIPQAEQKV